MVCGVALNQTFRVNTFSCKCLTTNFPKRNRRIFKIARPLQSMNLYSYWFWTSYRFLLICSAPFVCHKFLFWTAGTFLVIFIHCPPVLFVTKFIFLNNRDIFGGECPSFVRCWLATRIPRMFRFWKDCTYSYCTYSDCTYSAPRGAKQRWKLEPTFSGCGQT